MGRQILPQVVVGIYTVPINSKYIEYPGMYQRVKKSLLLKHCH